ncbi:MAG: MATE family efflux transporter [Firmicutes bacterium]|nr:MATE family efflux transporter [Bacillota bacterium]
MAEKKTLSRDLTTGNVTRTLINFAFPLFLSNLLQAVYNIVDMVVVGNVCGSAGMSAVAIGGDVLRLLTFISMGFSNSGQIVISQFMGAGLKDNVRKVIGTLFTFLIFASVVMGALCFIFRHAILTWLNTPAEAYPEAIRYTVTCIAGIVFIYGYNVVSAVLRGMGDSRRPFMFIAIAAVLNTVLDIWFVAGLGMQAFGAALATVIAQGVSFIVSIVYLIRKKDQFLFDFKLSSFRIDPEMMKPLFKLGVPLTIQSASIQFSMLYVTRWINSFGLVWSAMTGAVNKIKVIAMLVSNAFNTAGGTMVGQNIGAEEYRRVPRILLTVLGVTGAAAVVMSVAYILLPEAIIGIFTSDASVIALASTFIPAAVVNFFGSSARGAAFALINGSGNSKLNLTVALLDGIVARIGFSYLFAFTLGMGCPGLWMGDACAGLVPGVIGIVYYVSGKWRTRKYIIDRTGK